MTVISKSIFHARSLKRRVRPDYVIDELSQLNGSDNNIVLRRILESSKERRLSKEALVTVLRSFLEAGQKENADKIFVELVKNLSGAISNRLVNWKSLSGSEDEDTRQTIVFHLYEYFYSLDVGEELWECNFKICFDCRLLNILGKLTRRKPNILVSNEKFDDGDTNKEVLEIPDGNAETSFEEIEVREAIEHLEGIDSRLGRTFFLKYFSDLPEKEIADMMDVNERTIRNWIVSCKKLLQQYYQEAYR